MQYLLALDHSLFLLINHLPHTLLLDQLALFFSALGTWGAVWFCIAFILFLREEKRDHWFFLPVVLASGLSVFVSELVLKHIFARGRPPFSLGTINVGALLTDYSFPSGHATFAWALGYILAQKEPRAKFFFYALAILISLSRIYLGKHYPLDVIGGSFIGLGIGYMSLKIERMVAPKRVKK